MNKTLEILDAIKYHIKTMADNLDIEWGDESMNTLALGQRSGLNFALDMIDIAQKDPNDLIKRMKETGNERQEKTRNFQA